MYKILIIEDEETIADTIQEHLREWGYDTRKIQNFKNVYEEFLDYQPQLVLLDIKLPFYNGYHWCEKIRTTSKVPVIFLSSADDNMNIVMAMSLGGDDFIAKPFDLTILMAKIQAMLRRTYDFAAQTSMLGHQGLILYTEECRVMYQDQKVELSKNESKILKVLLEQKDKVVSRETLMKYLWQTDSYVDENTLSVNVNRLRKKLEELGIEDMIETKKGLGYRLR